MEMPAVDILVQWGSAEPYEICPSTGMREVLSYTEFVGPQSYLHKAGTKQTSLVEFQKESIYTFAVELPWLGPHAWSSFRV